MSAGFSSLKVPLVVQLFPDYAHLKITTLWNFTPGVKHKHGVQRQCLQCSGYISCCWNAPRGSTDNRDNASYNKCLTSTEGLHRSAWRLANRGVSFNGTFRLSGPLAFRRVCSFRAGIFTAVIRLNGFVVHVFVQVHNKLRIHHDSSSREEKWLKKTFSGVT